ncbi:recombinase RecB [Natrialba sp. SSL1]|nr:recombinase RecB [Natrialba sp. SSL1]
MTLERPTPTAARDAIADGLEREALVTVFGRCTVDYDGRASSQLAAGDRHVMLKPDGAALVHTDEGQQPVNWQPPGCAHDVFCEPVAGEDESDEPEADGSGSGSNSGNGNDSASSSDDVSDSDTDTDTATLVLESTRSTPEERLLVRFQNVLQVSTFAGTDEGELTLSGTEADLRDRILENPDLLESGFTPLATERDTPAGAIDIYGEDDAGRTVIVELKRRRVGPDAVSQLRRYVDALERDLHADTTLRGILVAPSVTERAQRLLGEHGLEFVSLEPTDSD